MLPHLDEEDDTMGLLAAIIIAGVSLMFAIAAIGPMLIDLEPRDPAVQPGLRVIPGGRNEDHQEAA